MRHKAFGFGLVALVAVLGTGQAALTWQDKAAEVLAATRKAIGGGKVEGLQTFSAVAHVQRNVGTFRTNSDVELFLEMPDKYVRSEASSGGPVSIQQQQGFNGDASLTRIAGRPGGGAMVFQMGPGGPTPMEQLTPEQKAEMDAAAVRSSRYDISRMTLGWFGMAHPSINAKYAYVGEAESPDGKADVIEITDANSFKARLFVDQQTRLPLMLTYQAPRRRLMSGGMRVNGAGAAGVQTQVREGSGGKPMTDEERKKLQDDIHKQIEASRAQPPDLIEYQLFFSDWADMEGIKFPRRIQRAAEGTTEEEWEISKIKVNPRIDRKKFEIQ